MKRDKRHSHVRLSGLGLDVHHSLFKTKVCYEQLFKKPAWEVLNVLIWNAIEAYVARFPIFAQRSQNNILSFINRPIYANIIPLLNLQLSL